MNRKILDLAIPNIISSISVPLIGIVDMALMGRMPSADYIGGVALGSLILNFIYWDLDSCGSEQVVSLPSLWEGAILKDHFMF